jgi:predicted metal-dependent enzyme (double-stranded beta helix superfamily)
MTSTLPLRAFVRGLRDARAQARGEPALLLRVRELASTFAAHRDDWLTADMCRPDPEQGFGMYTLHEEDDHTLAVFVVSWLPGRGTPVHDHGTWAVIAGLHGAERNEMWRRTDDGRREGRVDLARVGARSVAVGDVIVMPTGAIHSVHNDSPHDTVSLHVYGRHINHTERARFDPDAGTCTPYQVKVLA